MKIDNGFIKLHRKLLTSPVNDNAFAMHLWINLLLITHWNKNPLKQVMATGNGVKQILLQRGQCAFYKSELAKNLDMSKNTFRKYLLWLEEEEMIETIYSGRFTIVRIVKWDQFQSPNSLDN